MSRKSISSDEVTETEEVANLSLTSQVSNHMTNSNILSLIFDSCDIPHLLTLRQVSKQWYSLSLSRVRKEATVTNPYRLCRLYEGGGGPPLLWTRSNLVEKPFRCFHLHHVEFGPWPLSREGEPRALSIRSATIGRKMTTFWEHVGPQIHKLVLSTSLIFNVDAFRLVIFEQTPNLQELTLHSTKMEGLGLGRASERREVDNDKETGMVTTQNNLKSLNLDIYANSCLPFTWLEFFTHFPNIQKLELRKCLEIYDKAFPQLVDALESLTIRKRPNLSIKVIKLNEKEVGIWQNIGENQFLLEKFVQSPHLQLEVFILNANSCQNGENILRGVMQRHSSTLKRVRFVGNSPCKFMPGPVGAPWDDFPFHTSQFKNLSELQLEGYICSNFHFLAQLPNLRSLALINCYPNILEETDLERIANLVLPQLRFFQVQVSLSLTVIEMFGRVMPNLTTLKTHMGGLAFRASCRIWSNLSDLEIVSYSSKSKGISEEAVDDESITGIVPGSEDRFPNITDLKYLQKCAIISDGEIGDASVWNGFLKLSHLRHLSVEARKGVSDEAYDALIAHMPQPQNCLAPSSPTNIFFLLQINDFDDFVNM